ncbi:glycosyltransferase family 25 protein [Bradyrhizobium sp. CB1650]|uniref:glycosyltransferase family 25 protein n=1 Tax=Bradyrhizobium sp. CB1650 TaxID=3039153 RepID=UPI0024357EFF|nr:glycosyltransferase family 25 protein [Bradyrhizobium sp. CB1650]WGD54943.1 glycosyltransferase family 25 protein [Bradyrhizobium sp. CB1650]
MVGILRSANGNVPQMAERALVPTPAGRSLLDTFEATRIINLKARQDRRREMASELARLGLAADGRKVGFHDASNFDSAYPFPTAGARGCFHSHLAVFEEARLKHFENVLILEDDCDFVGSIEVALVQALEALSEQDWSMFFGGHEDLERDERQPGPVQRICPGSWVRGTHFVAARRKAIELMVPFLHEEIARLAIDPLGGSPGIDAAYTNFGKRYPELRYFVAWPKLAYQRPSRTDIARSSVFDRLPVANLLVVPARRLKRYLKRSAS